MVPDNAVIVPIDEKTTLPERTWSWKFKLPVLLLCFVCSMFTQYESVAPCLVGFHALYLSLIFMERKFLILWLESLLPGFGLALSMSQMFRPGGEEGWDWFSFGIVFAIQICVIHLFLLLGKIHVRFARYPRRLWFFIFTYPVLVCAAYAIMALFTPLASQASMAYAFSEWQSFVQIVSVFGLTGLNLTIVISSTCICHFFLIDEEEGIQGDKRRVLSARLGIGLPLAVWLFGSFRLAAPLIYQKGVDEVASPSSEFVEAACIVRSGTYDPVRMVSISEKVLNESKSVKFLIWSEYAAGDFYDDTQGPMNYNWQQPLLSDMFSEVQLLAVTHNATIGVTYGAWVNPNDPLDELFYNQLTFFNSSGSVIGDYTKRYPVPVIESDVVASNDDLAYIEESTIGEFNAAICYDLDRPEFVRSGASTGMLVQTANSWGVVGHFHAISSSFRAVENGMYLLRCGSNGPSGLYDPYGSRLAYQNRKDTDAIYFQVPVSPDRIWTFYSNIGFVIDYILIAISGLYFLILALSFKRSLAYRL